MAEGLPTVGTLRFASLQPLFNTVLAGQLRAVRTHPSIVSLAAADYAREDLNGTVVGSWFMLQTVLINRWFGVDSTVVWVSTTLHPGHDIMARKSNG